MAQDKMNKNEWTTPLLGEACFAGDERPDKPDPTDPYLDEYWMIGILKICDVDLKNYTCEYIRLDELEDAIQEQKDLKLFFGEAGYGRDKRKFVLDRIEERLRLRERDGSIKHQGRWKEKAKDIADGSQVTTLQYLDIIIKEPSYIISWCMPEFFEKEDLSDQEDEGLTSDEKRVRLADNAMNLYDTELELMNVIKGQEEAIDMFIRGLASMKLFKSDLGGKRGPAGIFLFAGPPGVGKTLLATTIAKLLGYEFLILDMTNYSREIYSIESLVGFDSTYIASHEGSLTGFVDKYPKSIIVFDEIEKAASDVIYGLLPILDRGAVTDKFFHREISFKQTICVFTTNAGRSLYDGNRANVGEISKEVILEALQTEKKPGTDMPFFPPELCSRLSTGTLIMFRHLSAGDLTDIADAEMHRCASAFKESDGIEVDLDPQIPGLLLLQEGGESDARNFRNEAGDFIEREIYNLTSYIEPANMENRMGRVKKISFIVDEDPMKSEKTDQKPNVLVYIQKDSGNPKDTARSQQSDEIRNKDFERAVSERLRDVYDLDFVSSYPEVEQKIGEKKEYLFAMALVPTRSLTSEELGDDPANHPDKIPPGATRIQNFTRNFLKPMKDECPNVPVYVFYTTGGTRAFETEAGLIRAGARKVILVDRKGIDESYDFDSAVIPFKTLGGEIGLEREAGRYARQHKALRFDTKPKMLADEFQVHLYNFRETRNISGSDRDAILSDGSIPSVSFADVIGAQEAKRELLSFVDYLKNPKQYTDRGLPAPKGILLYGPPGTGKTYLAEALAHEADVAYFPTNGGDLAARGVSGVEELFDHARRYSPAVIFIDEIDAIGKERNGYNSVEATLNKLLSEMDGFDVDQNRPVFVMAATNFPLRRRWEGQVILDEALTRRFDRRIEINLPNTSERKEYLTRQLERFNYNKDDLDDKNIENIAKRTAQYNFPQLNNIVMIAARRAMEEGGDDYCITSKHLNEALISNENGEENRISEKARIRTARHEAGHACLAIKTGKPPLFITISPRNGYNGYVMPDPERFADDDVNCKNTMEEIMEILGGRAAELIYYGPEKGTTAGARSDLRDATNITLNYIMHYGMDESAGLGSFPDDYIPENVRTRVNQILQEQFVRARSILIDMKPVMDKLVDELLKRNTLSTEEIMEIIDEIPPRERMAKKIKCPVCGSMDILTITNEWSEDDRTKGQSGDNDIWWPKYYCTACDRNFGSDIWAYSQYDFEKGKFNDVTCIELSISPLSGENEHFIRVQKEDDHAEVEYRGFNEKNTEPHSISISKDDWNELRISLCRECFIYDWDKKYEPDDSDSMADKHQKMDPDILSWKLTVTMADGTEKESSGDGKFPPYWDEAIKLLTQWEDKETS